MTSIVTVGQITAVSTAGILVSIYLASAMRGRTAKRVTSRSNQKKRAPSRGNSYA